MMGKKRKTDEAQGSSQLPPYYQHGTPATWMMQMRPNQPPMAFTPQARPVVMIPQMQEERIRRLDEVAVAVYQRALSDGRSIAVANILNSLLFQIGAYSLESLGLQMQQIPCLRTLSAIEGKVNAFISSYVAGNRITTLHDVVHALCVEEKVTRFDELGLGPLLEHALVIQFFGKGLREVYKITAFEVLQCLLRLMHRKNPVDEQNLLSFLAMEKRTHDVSSLGVRIRNLGMYVGILREVKKKENDALEEWRSTIPKSEEVQPTPRKKNPTHIRFIYSDSDSEEHNEPIHRYSTCPFPSAAEEEQKKLSSKKPHYEFDYSMDSSSLTEFITKWEPSCNMSTTEVLNQMLELVTNEKLKTKLLRLFKSFPGLELLNVAVVHMKARKKTIIHHQQDMERKNVEFDFTISGSDILQFVTTWKDACRTNTVTEVLHQLLAAAGFSKKKTRKRLKLFKSYPALQILNVVITSLKTGWKSIQESKSNIHAASSEDFSEPAKAECSPDAHDKLLTELQKHLKKISEETRTGDNWGSILQCITSCENHITSIFSKDILAELGYSSFLDFFSKNVDKLGDIKITRKACTKEYSPVLRHRIAAFVRQAYDLKSFNRGDILQRCREQFQLRIFEEPLINEILDKIKPDESLSMNSHASKVYYAAALNEDDHMSDAHVGKLGSISTKDAENKLSRAPMLSDLGVWSQWKLVFEPQLGPLQDWLEQNGILTVIVARGGERILRIDTEAGPERFLSAIAQGRVAEAASQLISILVLHGGSANAPKELLRLHALNGLKIMSERHNQSLVGFFNDFLNEVPTEFAKFSTEIIFNALNSLIPEYACQVLGDIRCQNQRSFLHGLGLSLGISEWIEDYTVEASLDPAQGESHPELNEGEPAFKRLRLYTETITLHDSPDKNVDASTLHKEEGEIIESMPVDVNTVETEGEAQSVITDAYTPEHDATEVIKKIRQEEFGLIEGNIKGNLESELLAKQHARIGRALQCLSQNLYSEDCHFILELVQNADDNVYSSGTIATLAFIIMENRIVVLNNEQGFTAENIRALCDIGNSTKKLGSAAGYIGHKGIGFKSVFRITDSPTIHSNGFHVKFDISQSSLGFILPTLVEPPSDDNYFAQLLQQKMNTRIDLPLRQSEATKSVSDMFNDLQPSLLLFLHKLQTLVVHEQVTGIFRSMCRQNLPNGLVKLRDGEKTTTFLVAKKEITPPIERSGVSTTELSLAFELKEVSNGLFEPVIARQQVFAFLPVRSYGLKFIVQGDFILPSSREDLDRDSVWNQWLRSEIPKLFQQAFELFRSSDCFGSLFESVTAYMNFVPLEGEVLGFFSSIPRIIISNLRAMNCLPVEDGENGYLVLPCTTLRGWEDSFKHLVPQEALRRYLGLFYLDHRVNLNEPLASALGVRKLDVATILDLLKASVSDLQYTSLGVEWVRKMLLRMYKCITSERSYDCTYEPEERIYKELQGVPCVPISDGGFASLQDGIIWVIDTKEEHSELFRKLYSEMKTVDPILIGNDAESGIIKEILIKAGAMYASAHDVVKTHILPLYMSDNCFNKDPDLVVEYLAYCMLHFREKCQSCETEDLLSMLSQHGIVLTDNGLQRISGVHFGKDLGNTIDTREILEGTDVVWHEIKAVDYLKLNPSMAVWREFFASIGVRDFIHVVAVAVEVCDKSSTIWKNETWQTYEQGKLYTAYDWESPELTNILSDRKVKAEQYGLLLAALDSLWDQHYSEYSIARYKMDDDEKESGICFSSFVLRMRQCLWVRSSLDGELHAPIELFQRSETVENILGVYAHYAEPQIRNNALADALGLRKDVQLHDVVMLLKLLKEAATCVASLTQMEAMYTYLWENIDGRELKSIFESSPSIFLPYTLPKKRNKRVTGRLYTKAQVAWSDPFQLEDIDGICQKLHVRTLSRVYPGLRDFFLDSCRVCRIPDFDGYITMIQQITAVCTPSIVIEKVLELFAHWSQEIESGKVEEEEVLRRRDVLRDSRASIFPTLQNTWTSLNADDGIVCWCDDINLAKEFDADALSSVIKFVNTGEELKSLQTRKSASVLPFLKALGLPRFSEVVEREAVVYGTNSYTELESIFHRVIPYGQRYLLEFHMEAYKAFMESSTHLKLQELKCLTADKLFCRYTISNTQVSSLERLECNCLLQGNVLYVSSSHSRDYTSIYLELSRIFFNGQTNTHLANFLHLITLQALTSPDVDLESIATSSHGLKPLPDQHTPWETATHAQEEGHTLSAQAILERQRLKSAKSSNSSSTPLQKDKFVQDAAREEESTPVQDTPHFKCTESSAVPANLYVPGANSTEQQEYTGRQGEKIVYEHLRRKYPTAKVTWVNEKTESGFAYDIIVDRENDVREYVEVKATRSSNKNWFEMSAWEWEFANKMGDKYSVVRVSFVNNQHQAKLTVLNNPVQLCRDKVLQLAIVIPQQT